MSDSGVSAVASKSLKALAIASAVFAGALVLLHFSVPPIAASLGYDNAEVIALFDYFARIGPGAICLLALAYWVSPRVFELSDALAARWRPAYTNAALAGACVFLAAIIFHYGNRQFGGFDLSLLIDVAWRIVSGQSPHTDFICTLPPGFYLGAAYAFRLFGVSWNAILYLTILLSWITFLWTYWLLGLLLRSRLAALLTALLLQFIAILLPSYWWHNSLTSVFGAIFLLSTLAYLRRPSDRLLQLSYAVSVAVLASMKPNIAGALLAGGVILLLIAIPDRVRALLLTAAGAVALLAFLVLNGISIPALIASYRDAAVDRGVSAIGFVDLRSIDLYRAIVFIALLLLPFTRCAARLLAALRGSRYPEAAAEALFLLAPAVAFLGMLTNAELKDVDWCCLVACGAVPAFPPPAQSSKTAAKATPAPVWRWERLYVAALCALAASDLYMTALRYRIERTGYQTFYRWVDADRPTGAPFFADLKAPQRFADVLAQTAGVLRQNPGPIFFGPRMEFLYAVYRVPSPLHIPLWWHPGTSYAIAREDDILRAWIANRFQTLIFLKNDFSFYSPKFLYVINALYERDDRYPELTVFHPRAVPRP